MEIFMADQAALVTVDIVIPRLSPSGKVRTAIP